MSILLAVATELELKAIVTGFNGKGRASCAVDGAVSVGSEIFCSASAFKTKIKTNYRSGTRRRDVSTSFYCPVNNRDCYFLITGVGPVNAALALGRAVAENPDIKAVINLGIAGSYDLEAAPVGSVVLATEEFYPEYGLYGQKKLDPEQFPFSQYEGAEGAVWDSIALKSSSYADFSFNIPEHALRGPFVTVGSVSADKERAGALASSYAALAENMEGFPLALGCLQKGLPFMELRAISNQAGVRDKALWDIPKALNALGGAARTLFSHEF